MAGSTTEHPEHIEITPVNTGAENCPHCEKLRALCMCETLTPHDNRVHVLVLQHPQEPDKDLGTARMATRILSRSTLRVGLSAANLKAALGGIEADPSGWIVLYLGAKYKFRALARKENQSDLYTFDKNDVEVAMPLESIRGVVILDGTWAQAKTMWWRNPWLLKLRRAVINPRAKSLYGHLRKEPRHECLSTIESIAYTLEVLGEDPAVTEALLNSFRTLLLKYRDYAKNSGRVAAPKRDMRHKHRGARSAGSRRGDG